MDNEAQPIQNSKLEKIRSLISEHAIDAYVVFHNDAHQVILQIFDSIIEWILS